MNPRRLWVAGIWVLTLLLARGLTAAEQPRFSNLDPVPQPRAASPVSMASLQYVLRQGDVIQIKVYEEEDLTSVCRIGKEGMITMPLVGAVRLAGNTVGQAAVIVRDLLAKDYLVHPQVTLSVTEFAKRRFTVLGEVQRPGTYDMPPEESVSLLQAIAAAGGYTRIGNPHNILVQRTVGSETKLYRLDADAMSLSKADKPFEIQPDDVVVIAEKWI